MKMDFMTRIMRDKIYALLFLRGRDVDGDVRYAYISVRVDEIEQFAAAQKAGAVQLEDYGKILAQGIGSPPQKVRDAMEQVYHFSHDDFIMMKDEDVVQ